MTYTDLQNGLYNLIAAAVSPAQGASFQLVQPPVALPSTTNDAALWAFMNAIPTFSLSHDYSQSGGDLFFSGYEAVMSALTPSLTIDFEGDITTPVFNEWLAFVASLPSPPAVTQLPNLFLNWAFATHPDVAEKGAADLSALILEPVHQAQLSLMPYLTVPGLARGKPPDWTLGYSQLVAQLAAAPGKVLSSTSLQSNANVANSWTRGNNIAFHGLWGGSPASSLQSATFASQSVRINISFAHLTTFTPAPGSWYNSEAFGLAFANQSGPPWNPNSAITWPSTFGPSGNLQRVASSLVVVSGMKVTASTTARFSALDQAAIKLNSGRGFWPFYTGVNGNLFSTKHVFDPFGALTISMTSPVGVPVLLGVNVLTTSQYTGHAVSGLRLFRQLVGIKFPQLPVFSRL